MYTVEIVNIDEWTACWNGAIAQLVKGVQDGVGHGCREGAADALATRRWKDKTGAARDALRGYVDTWTNRGASGWIELLVPYASYLADGTEPHDIYPKAAWGTPKAALKPGQTVRASGKGPHEHIVGRGQFLRWKNETGEHFARVVHHPGTQGDFFLERGVATCEGTIRRDVDSTCISVQRRWLDA